MLLPYTYLTFALFLATFAIRDRIFCEFVRATVFFVLIGWALVVGLYDYEHIVTFFRRHLNVDFDIRTVIVMDFLVHVLPVVVLGVPIRIAGKEFMVAATCVVIWYSIYRKYIPDMYYLPHRDIWARDFIVYGGFLCFIVLNVATNCRGLRLI